MIDIAGWWKTGVGDATKSAGRAERSFKKRFDRARHTFRNIDVKDKPSEVIEELMDFIDHSPKAQDAIRKIVAPVANTAKKAEEVLHRGDTRLPDFPRAFQPNTYSCGAESVYVVLKYFYKTNSIKQVTKELHTTREGTGPRAMRNLLKKRGLSVRRFQGKSFRRIKQAIENDAPILVFLDEGDHGHWGVVFGFSETTKHIWLSDPSLKRHRKCRMEWGSFKETWSGYGLVVAR